MRGGGSIVNISSVLGFVGDPDWTGQLNLSFEKGPWTGFWGVDMVGNPVFLRDIWPSSREIADTVAKALTPQMFRTRYADVFKGDKQWHHETVTVADAVLRQGGTKGADFALVNTDAKDDIFSLIEVHRGKLESPALLPPTDYKVSDKGPRPPKADKANEDKKEQRKMNKKKE